MKKFLHILMMAFACWFDEPGDAGGGEGGGDELPGDATPPSNPNPAPAGDEHITLSKAQLAELVEPINEYRQEKAVNAAVSDIASRHEGFDIKKVGEYLNELFKTDPKKAEDLNDPKGWELLWMRELAPKSVKADEVNGGRNVSGESDRGDLIKKINSGNGSIEDHTELFMKYA
ncbi:hypothetical protein [Sulfuricurvum sp.]|uniref:hypothetical protein n=1 Tax=Sulfuricurvum sp. TaxID=2025608 RepID=UPI0026160D08|nr:hypothetical protein [Sulfuricurvum sp.]MDD2267656.1 hypothetical protein [Sulfuricurvum sp.]MDD2784255.1 hypothetical protein [Sulfuricurvum sp.]